MNEKRYNPALDLYQPVGAAGETLVGVIGSYAQDLVPVTPSENPVYDPPALIYLVADGALEVMTSSGEARSYPAGTSAPQSVIPLKVAQIRAGTTATVYAVRLES